MIEFLTAVAANAVGTIVGGFLLAFGGFIFVSAALYYGRMPDEDIKQFKDIYVDYTKLCRIGITFLILCFLVPFATFIGFMIGPSWAAIVGVTGGSMLITLGIWGLWLARFDVYKVYAQAFEDRRRPGTQTGKSSSDESDLS